MAGWIELLCHRPDRSKTTRWAVFTVTADIWAAAMTGEFAAAWMPSIFIPLAGVLGPAVVMVLMFNMIESTD